eukprot:tig00000944_g5937.t1
MPADGPEDPAPPQPPAARASETASATSVLCNYLPGHVSEQVLIDLFKSHGTIESAKIVRDKFSGKSLGFGFVNFSSKEEASQAVSAMNGFQINSKTIKVQYARPSAADGTNTNLYITGLPPHFTKSELDALFSPHGTIIDSKILVDLQTGVSRGVGFVRFEQREQADAATTALQGFVCEGGTTGLVIKYAESETDRLRRQRQSQMHHHAHGAMFHHPHHAFPLASPAGPSAAPATAAAAAPGAAVGMGVPLGMGMAMPWAGPRAGPRPMGAHRRPFPGAQDYSGMHFDGGFDGQAAYVNGGFVAATASGAAVAPGPASPEFADGQGGQASNYVVYIYGLPYDCDEQLLFSLFAPYGEVTSVRVMRDFRNNNACKGFGFVHMPKYESAVAAIAALDGQQLAQKRLQVSFKSAKRGAAHGSPGAPVVEGTLLHA